MKSRAAILHDVGGPWSVEEFQLDPPRAGEVLVEMAAAGLCHSDDHILKGDLSAPTRCCDRSACRRCSRPSAATKARESCVKSATVSPISCRVITW
ncbi:alcohol dehydrogenase GroES-like domain protein [Mycobacterium xenopi 4042]|uniref:Alcohol dehydrogenase GroES-like domain protein n=1 Tax=Mycobacterium xenopi 4042 TaxID=1299334 RepID=X8E5Q3_MYCXE|nr:alcohol dehydrogenase GroES-like domain protein [Mycobacterium xenopi 4042]